jgi:hypothetical protein
LHIKPLPFGTTHFYSQKVIAGPGVRPKISCSPAFTVFFPRALERAFSWKVPGYSRLVGDAAVRIPAALTYLHEQNFREAHSGGLYAMQFSRT